MLKISMKENVHEQYVIPACTFTVIAMEVLIKHCVNSFPKVDIFI